MGGLGLVFSLVLSRSVCSECVFALAAMGGDHLMVDYSLTSADAWWAISQCVMAWGLGWILGMKIKLVRKIEEMV